MDMVELDRSLERGLLALWRAIWRSKLLFLFVGGMVFALIVVGSLAIQPIYEGSTLLIGGQNSLELSPDGSRRQPETSASLASIAESEEVVGEAIEKIGLATLVPDPGPPATSLFSRLRQLVFPSKVQPRVALSPIETYLPGIKQALNVRGQPNSDIIRIAFRNRDPIVAAAFANAVAQTFVDRQIALQSRPGAADFFLRQRRRFDEEVQRASDELKDFSVKTGVYAADEQRLLLLRRLNDLETALALTRGSIAEKVGQKQALSDELRRLAPVSRSPFVSSLVDALGSPTAPRPGDSRVADDPPLLMVRVYQDSMVALFKINSDLAGAQTLLRQQQDEAANLRAELGVLSKNEQSFVSLKRGVDQATFNSDLYAKRMVEEQINAEANAAKLSSVRVLQKATVPLRPVSPNYLVVTLLAAMVGGGAGTGAALLNSRRRRVQGRRSRGARAAAALVFGCICLGNTAATKPLSSPEVPSTKVIRDNEAFPAGTYLAYIAPFSKGKLIYGHDYTESITVDATAFPAGSLFTWRWPDTPAPSGVYDFSAIDFGDYDNTIVPAPIPPRQVGQIRKLSETHDASFAGLLEGFDVIDDLFLTANPGDNATNLFEVEVFLHTPEYSANYVRGARRVGNFAGSGTLWTVAIDHSAGHIPDILFMPHDRADLRIGTVDLQAMLAYLVDAHVIPATVYFNGFAFGTETQRGAGEMRVAAFVASYE